jgi:hypothetical protein
LLFERTPTFTPVEPGKVQQASISKVLLILMVNSKILTTVVSLFTSFYVRLWPQYFPDDPLPALAEAPSFDGRRAESLPMTFLTCWRRIVQYPNWQEIVDYFKWRQVDSKLDRLSSRETLMPPKSAHQQSLQHLLLGSSQSGRSYHQRGARRSQSALCLFSKRSSSSQRRAPSQARSTNSSLLAFRSTITSCPKSTSVAPSSFEQRKSISQLRPS